MRRVFQNLMSLILFIVTLQVTMPWGYGKVKVRLDMGRKQPNKEGYESIYAGDKKRKFNTMMEVLDYMSKRGWKVHTTYVITESMSKQNVLHFLLEKQVTDDSQIDEGLELGNED